jgi:type IV pilus assembly protein PilM
MPETIGLDIGSHSIKLIGLKTTSKGPFLTCLGMREIPPNKDKEDVKAFSETLKTLVEEVGLKTKKVNLVVSGSGVQIKRISIPSLPRAELKEAVRWEIKDHLPFPVETAEIVFHIVKEYVDDNVKRLDLLVVACPKPLIERTLSIAEGAGLQPIHLDVGPFALWNTLLVWNQLRKEETVALIELGAEKTGIYIFKNRILQFSREVTPAGADITKAIIEGIGPEGDPERIFKRAEGIKQEMGIPSEPSQERTSNKSASLSKISFLVRPVLERLSAEIGRSLDYYRAQFNEERIDRLLLTGGGANLKNIVSYLAGELRLPIEHFNPLSDILFDPKRIGTQFLNEMGSIFTVAVGVALPEPKRIELLPAKEPFLSKLQMGRLTPVLAPLIIFFVFLAIILYMNGKTNAIQKEINLKKAKLANLVVLQEKLKLLKEKDLQIKQKLSQFPASMLVSVPYRDILREFNNILPDNVALTLLSVQNKGKPLKKGSPSTKSPEGESQKDEGKELHITGMAFGSDAHCLRALAQIIERFEKSPLYQNVKLTSADENKLYTQPGAGFEIVCDINLSNPPSPTDTSFSPLYKRGDGGITNITTSPSSRGGIKGGDREQERKNDKPR